MRGAGRNMGSGVGNSVCRSKPQYIIRPSSQGGRYGELSSASTCRCSHCRPRGQEMAESNGLRSVLVLIRLCCTHAVNGSCPLRWITGRKNFTIIPMDGSFEMDPWLQNSPHPKWVSSLRIVRGHKRLRFKMHIAGI